MPDLTTSPIDFKPERSPISLWKIFTVLFVLLLGLLTFAWFYDANPPEDQALLPTFTEGGGKDNALLVFVNSLNPTMFSGSERLSQPVYQHDPNWDEKARKALDEPAVQEFFVLWSKLMQSDETTWRFRIQDKPLDLSASSAPPAFHQIHMLKNVTQLPKVELAAKLREGLHVEALDVAFEMLKCARGYSVAEGVAFHFALAQSLYQAAYDALEDILRKGNFSADELAQIQSRLLIHEDSHQLIKHLLQTDYWSAKIGFESVKEDDSQKSNKRVGFFRKSMHSEKNDVLQALANQTIPYLDPKDQGVPELIQIMKLQALKLQQEYDRRGTDQSLSQGVKSDHLTNLRAYAALRFEQLIHQMPLADARAGVLRLQIALRLYEMKHGKLPETLEVLLTESIDTLPLDPFDGKPLRWNPKTQRLYSIGWDLTDEGGKFYKDWDLSYRSPDRGMEYLWKPEVQNQPNASRSRSRVSN